MEQQKILDEIGYYKAQAITELLYTKTSYKKSIPKMKKIRINSEDF